MSFMDRCISCIFSSPSSRESAAWLVSVRACPAFFAISAIRFVNSWTVAASSWTELACCVAPCANACAPSDTCSECADTCAATSSIPLMVLFMESRIILSDCRIGLKSPI